MKLPGWVEAKETRICYHIDGIALKAARKQVKMTLKRLAKASGYRLAYISDIENGHRKTMAENFVRAVASALDKSPPHDGKEGGK